METTKTESPENENFITKGPSNPDDLCRYKKKKKHPITYFNNFGQNSKST